MTCRSESHLLDHYIYTHDATLEAAKIFREFCHVDISNLGDATQVNIGFPTGAPASIGHEFLNYVLGISVEQLLNQT